MGCRSSGRLLGPPLCACVAVVEVVGDTVLAPQPAKINRASAAYQSRERLQILRAIELRWCQSSFNAYEYTSLSYCR